MPTSDLPVASTSALPADLAALGPSPLIASDDAATYDTLLAGMCAAVRPADMIERAWTRDVVDLVLETLRLRRLKAALMTSCADQGMQKLLDGINVPGDTCSLARRWAARDLAAVGEVDAILNAAGLGINHVMAKTLAVRIAEIERIDAMTASAEARRAAALREIAHHRAQFAARLRGAAAAHVEAAA